jgi:structural maintenance of chromosome 1
LTALFETISGSAALREDYEAAELAMKDAEAAVSVMFSKRKAIAAEKRIKKEQKDEAERHMRLQQELDSFRIRHALWKVFHIQEDADQQRERARTLKADVASAEADAHAADSRVESCTVAR